MIFTRFSKIFQSNVFLRVTWRFSISKATSNTHAKMTIPYDRSKITSRSLIDLAQTIEKFNKRSINSEFKAEMNENLNKTNRDISSFTVDGTYSVTFRC
jgi:hypothetical protein